MDTEQPRQVPDIKFRVLIIGRANAGKTSILQRVCETTESPIIYRKTQWKTERVRLEPSMERGEHNIDDELTFSNDLGYIFHDSRGIESGSIMELRILQDFIKRKCGEKRLRDRLHAIWYCVPMDNQRPQLDLKFYKDICPDKNVPVIVVFTKYDQFLHNVQMELLDYPDSYPDGNVSETAKTLFQEHYLGPLGNGVKYVQLQKMHSQRGDCRVLIERTAGALNPGTLALMLLAVQKGNLELGVKVALNRVYSSSGVEAKHIVWGCLRSFPYLWLIHHHNIEFADDDDPDYMGNQHIMRHIMTLPTIKKHLLTSLNQHYLMLAVIIILKHASFLLLSNLSAKSALTQAEIDYRAGNTALKIQQFLTGSPQEHTVGHFSQFIMANDIVSPLSVKTQVHSKEHWLKQLWEQIFLPKSHK